MAGPQTRTVWLVGAGRAEAAEGRLTLDGDGLRFLRAEGPGLTVPLDRIVGARKRPGTPMLVVRYRDDAGRTAKAFFFFSPPPPIASREDLRARRRPFLPSSRGLERTASIMTLRAAAAEVRREIREWAGAIRGAVERRRS